LTKDVWTYTAQILPSLAVNRIVSVADRLVLFRWTTLDGLGIYGVASRFTSGLKLLTGGLKLAIAPAMSRAEAESTDSWLLYSKLSRLMLLAMLSIGSALMVSVWFIQFTPWADRAVEVGRLVGILLFAQFLGGLGLVWQLAFFYSARPQGATLASTASAITLFLALFMLVPSFGLTGAACAQLIAAVVNVVIMAVIEARLHGHLRSRQELIGLSAMFIPTLLSLWILPFSYQPFVLVPTFVIYAMITILALRQLLPLRQVYL
jgi:O-antigen/teichoic acid export membrane protein